MLVIGPVESPSLPQYVKLHKWAIYYLAFFFKRHFHESNWTSPIVKALLIFEIYPFAKKAGFFYPIDSSSLSVGNEDNESNIVRNRFYVMTKKSRLKLVKAQLRKPGFTVLINQSTRINTFIFLEIVYLHLKMADSDDCVRI